MLRKAYLLLCLVLLSPLVQALPTVQFSSATYNVDEDAGTVTITVSISEPPNNTVTVDYSTSDDTAEEGEDYTKSSGTLRWDLFDGDDKTVTVQINDDIKIEGDETFNLTLENPDGTKLGDQSTTVVTIDDDEIPPPQGILKFSSVQYEFDEGDRTVDIPVKRIGGSQNIVSVKCVSSDGTAKAGEDYTDIPDLLEWGHGDDTDKHCKVEIIDDTEIEGNEVFNLRLEEVTGGAIIGDPSTAGVTIIDNDQYPGTLQFSSVKYEVIENEGSVVAKVIRVNGDDGAVSVDYTSYDNTAKAGEDYSSVSGTLYWGDGDTDEKTITVPITDDNTHEGKEIFILKLSNPTNGAELGIPNSVVVTITDDDEPHGIFQFTKENYSVHEDGEIIEVPVARVEGSNGAVSVYCVSYDGTATAWEDYLSVSGRLEWGNGDDKNKTCLVSILDDSEYEGDETFELRLENATGGAVISEQDTTVVTIIDDEPPVEHPGTLQFSEATSSVGEGEETVTIIVTRVDGKDGAVSVECIPEDGSATAGDDYTAVTDTLNWADQEDGEQSCTVPILDDEVFEGDETFNLTLDNVTGGADIGDPNSAVVTIKDDDQVAGTLQFSDATYKVKEGNGTVTFAVTREGGKDGAVSVECISSDGTATAGDDYTAVTDTLNWADQEDGEQFCTVPILDDEVFESNETFNLTLDNVTGGADIGSPSTAVVTIVDDEDPPPSGTLQFSELPYEVDEGEGIVTITVTRIDGSYGEASVEYTTKDGSALAGEDYTEITDTLSWDDGDASPKTFTVDIVNDSEYEESETFKVKLRKAEGATIGSPDTADVTIIDDDQEAGTLQFSDATYKVKEGDGYVTFAVTREGGKDGAVSVECISSDGTATAGDDYTAVTDTLNWADQEDGEQSCTVPILDDEVFEGDETFNIALEIPTGGAEIGTQDSAEVTIVDNDPEPERGTLQFSPATYEVGEGDGAVTITVIRDNGSYGAASVKVVSSDGSAEKGDDYVKVSKKLEWYDGEDGEKTVTVEIFDDIQVEGNETFELKLKKADGATIGDQDTAEVTIEDDDQEAGTLQFSNATYKVNEGDGYVTFAVTREGGMDGAVTVECTSSDSSATADSDYATVMETLNWADQEDGNKPCIVEILEDEDFEGNETFNIALEIPTGGAEIGTQDSAEVTIVDNDPEPERGTLQFSPATYEVGEGDGAVTITVIRDNGSYGAASVKVVSSDGSAEKGDDYVKVSKKLEWYDGEDGEKTVTVEIIDDIQVEGNETFELKLKKADSATIGSPGTVEVAITDNDSTYEPGTLQFSSATYEVNEGNRKAKIAVSRVGGSNGAISVECNSLDGSAAAGEDYETVSKILNWADGKTDDKNCTAYVIDDNVDEIDETFSLTLTNPTGGASIGDPDSAEVTIVDNDDEPKPGTLRFSYVQYLFSENLGTVTITVTREGGSSGKATVKVVSKDDSAEKNKDYNKVSEKLKWDDGEAGDKTFTVTILEDAEDEGDETFKLKLKNESGAELGSPKNAVVTIIDNDDESGVCDNVTEIPTIECEALVALYKSTDGANWTKNEDWNVTDTPCDWEGVTCDGGHVSRLYLSSGNLNGEMPPELGNLSGLERLLLFDKELSGAIPYELGNLSQLQYLWLQNNGLCGDILETLMETAIPPNVGYLKLDDNYLNTDVSDELEAWLEARNPTWNGSQTECPVPGALQFSKSTYNVNENKGTVILTVTRTGSSEGEVSVVCATSDESATAGDDYKELFETLIWADGDSSDKVCQIDILNDSDSESSETFIVSIGYPNGAELGTLNTVMVTIVDDE